MTNGMLLMQGGLVLLLIAYALLLIDTSAWQVAMLFGFCAGWSLQTMLRDLQGEAMIELPWPPRELSPNARVHWARRSKAAKAYKQACYALTKQSGVVAPEGRVLLVLEFVPPDRRRRDDDNMVGAFKHGRDGVAEALGIDDSRFVTQFSVSPEPVKGGAVRAWIGGEVGGEITEARKAG